MSKLTRLAIQSGVSICGEGISIRQFQMFANAVAAFEREECAQVCERIGETVGECPEMAGYCADAIRVRSKGRK